MRYPDEMDTPFLARWNTLSPWGRGFTAVAALVGILFAVCAAGVWAQGPFFWYPCSLNGLEARGQGQLSYLYAEDGARLGVISASRNRVPVSISQISPWMRKAIVSTEDRRFYQHDGIDIHGIVRALRTDVAQGGSVQGASTITQQLVRNMYLSDQRSLSRKLEEGCLAVKLDRKWSKDRILDAYLNQIYFGQRSYGIQTASRTFFDKPAANLTLPEAALLAGLPQSPSAYDPFLRPGTARRRRAEVLQALKSTGEISAAQYAAANRAPLGLHQGTSYRPLKESYLAGYISQQLVDLYGAERVRRGGLRIYTTLNAKMQHLAERSIIETLNRKSDPAGAVVSVDSKTGAIRAMAIAQKGRSLSFNIAADGQRQAGSTFKTFVLAGAVERKINPWSTTYLSAPFDGPNNWHVQTYEHTYAGKIPLEQATLASDNTVYARLTLDLGPARVADIAHQMGVQSDLKPIPPVGLGVNPVSPLDLAAAYTTLASGGVRHDPWLINRVTFPDGHKDEPGGQTSTRVLDPKVVGVVDRVLEANVRAGTGTAAALPGRPAAGKTGTTDNYADAWFAGYVPQLTTIVWVGYPQREQPMRSVHGISVAGGTFPAQIWHTFMSGALAGQRVYPFPSPGTPPFERWCGRYQFARSTADAKPRNGCPLPKPKSKPKPKRTKKTSTTTAAMTTVDTTTSPAATTTAPTTTQQFPLPPDTTTMQTTTAPAPAPAPTPTTTAPAPTTTAPTTTTTTTTNSGGQSASTYTLQPDAQPAAGKHGVAVQDVDENGDGVVRVGGLYYKAMNTDDQTQTITAGTKVDVISAQGDTAYVRASG